MSGSYIPPPDGTRTQHEGTAHLAIRNNFLRRSLTLLALKTTARFFRRDGACVPISKNIIVKTDPFVHLSEATTMEFVAANTSIPVPRVYCSFVHRNQAYIVMERISGMSFPEASKALSDAYLANIFAQLRHMIQELRALPPPPCAGVGSCIGGSLHDSRIPRSRPRFGPFGSIQDFHLWLRDELRPEDHPERENDED
jgi:serine/threonine protein kinase